MAGYRSGVGFLLGAVALTAALAGTATAGGAPIRPDAKLALERVDAEPAGAPNPALSFPGYGHEVGDDIYGDVGRQSARVSVPTGEKTKVRFRAENDGTETDTFRMKIVASVQGRIPRPLAATQQEVANFRVKYFRGGKNVTEKISDGTLREPNVAPASHARSIVAKVRVLAPDDPGERPPPLGLLFSVHSVKDPLTSDIALAEIFQGIDR